MISVEGFRKLKLDDIVSRVNKAEEMTECNYCPVKKECFAFEETRVSRCKQFLLAAVIKGLIVITKKGEVVNVKE